MHNLLSKYKYDTIYISRPQAAAPSQMKCKIVGSNQLPVGQTRISDVHINIKDKYGNDIIHVSITERQYE